MSRPASHADRGQLFGWDGSTMWVEQTLEAGAAELVASVEAGEELEDHRAGHRPPMGRPTAAELEELLECPDCSRPCYWNHFVGRWVHDE